MIPVAFKTHFNMSTHFFLIGQGKEICIYSKLHYWKWAGAFEFVTALNPYQQQSVLGVLHPILQLAKPRLWEAE